MTKTLDEYRKALPKSVRTVGALYPKLKIEENEYLDGIYKGSVKRVNDDGREYFHHRFDVLATNANAYKRNEVVEVKPGETAIVTGSGGLDWKIAELAEGVRVFITRTTDVTHDAEGKKFQQPMKDYVVEIIPLNKN